MIERVIRLSIANRGLVLLAAAALLAAGLVAVRSTPLDAIPDLSDVQVIVKTRWPGQSPQVVEDQVTYPLTTAMLAVPGATTVRGYSFFGDSYVYVVFAEGTDLYWARSRVLEYLAQVSGDLPTDARAELGPDATGVGWIYQYALVDRTGQHDIAELTSLQNWFLRLELQGVPGVAEVATIGGMVRQYQVTVDPLRLREFNLSLTQLRRALMAGNQETGGSVLEMAEAEYMIRGGGYATSVEHLEQIPVGRVHDGTPVLLRDVAGIDIGPQMRRGVGELNGEGEVVGGVIVMRWGGNALATISAVKARLAELAPGLPPGVEIVETYDRSALIQRAVDNLLATLGQEFVVVALVIAAFLLHLRSSLVIVVSLPLAVLAALLAMRLQGVNANIMSLGGIAIAIGTMVDGAIVMIDTLHRRLEREPVDALNRWRVVGDAACEVGPAIFVSLVIITLSFLPVFALEAQEGRLFRPLAFTKTYAMAAAAILAVTLIPVLMGYFVRGRIRPERDNPLARVLAAAYAPLLGVALRHPAPVLLLAVVLAGSAAWPALHIGSEFMPDLDEGDLLYMPSTFPAVSVGKVRQLLQQTNRMIMTVPEVASVHGKAGRADTATDPAPLTMIESVVRLKPRSQWRPGFNAADIRAELDAAVQVPGVSNVWIMPIRNRIDMLATGIKTPVGIKVAGPDLAVIADIGRRIETVLADVPGTASAYAERVVGGRYLDIEVRRQAAARYGMAVADVHELVRTAIGGAEVGTTVEGLERYPINLRYPRDWRDSLADIHNLPVVTPTGAHVPLRELADITITSGPGLIRSENARRSGWIYVDISGRDLGGYVDDARSAVAAGVDLPPGYSVSWSGQFEYLARARDRLMLIVPATLVLIIVLLRSVFGRSGEVVIIVVTLPLALAGGVWLMYLAGYNTSVATTVGFIALAGLTVETSLVMLVFLRGALIEARQRVLAAGARLTPDDLVAAVRGAALARMRPILMTDATVVAGLMPIMLGAGTGSEVMHRIAAPMMGGMAGELLLTLVVLPAAWLAWQQSVLRRSAPLDTLAAGSDA